MPSLACCNRWYIRYVIRLWHCIKSLIFFPLFSWKINNAKSQFFLIRNVNQFAKKTNLSDDQPWCHMEDNPQKRGKKLSHKNANFASNFKRTLQIFKHTLSTSLSHTHSYTLQFSHTYNTHTHSRTYAHTL